MLHLNYREVAQANIDEFDRLGAFHGFNNCLYHYGDTHFGCAIGIIDRKNELSPADSCIRILLNEGTISTDNRDRLTFIQILHDYKAQSPEMTFIVASATYDSSPPSTNIIPPSVYDLVNKITKPADLTRDLYKEIMRRLATEP